MATYNNEESKTPATGIVGTVLGGTALAAMSGILGGNGLNLFGSGSRSSSDEICSLRMQNAILTSEASATEKLNKGLTEVYTELRKQDKLQDQNLANLNSRVLALETAGPLKEQIFDGKISAVYDKITCCCNSANSAIQASNAAIASLQATVGNITKLVVPKDVICPEYMPRYNSFTVPTTPTTNA